MYQNAAGQRITLYLGALDGAPLETFRFDQQGPVASFYWVERGFGYAITGELPRPALQALATVVYEQLQHARPSRPARSRLGDAEQVPAMARALIGDGMQGAKRSDGWNYREHLRRRPPQSG
jgi:hypothetical protein